MKQKQELKSVDLDVLEIIEDKYLFAEFIKNTTEVFEEGETKQFHLDNYQKRMILDESHYIDVCTGRASGKCSPYNTLITLGDGSQVRIGLLSNKEFEAISYNEDLKPVISKARCVPDEIKQVYKISLESGRETECTDNHPFFTINGWVELKNLKVGDYVAIPTNLSEFGYKPVESDLRWVRVKNIVPTIIEQTYSIYVEKYHNYIQDNILVHNTEVLQLRILHDVISNKFKTGSANEVLLVTPNRAQLDPIFLRFIQLFRKHPLLKHFIDKNSINVSSHEIKLLNGSMIRCRIVGQAGDSNVVGMHVPQIYVDESQLINWLAWNSLLQTLNGWEDNFGVWVSGVPNGLRERNVLFVCDQQDEKFSRHNLSRLMSPRYTKEQYKNDLKQYGGEDSDDFVHLVCFPEGTPIVTSEGIKDITSIKVGDYVLSANGLYTKVTEIQNREYTGDLVGIKTFGDYRTYYSTPEHPILSTKTSKCTSCGKFDWKCWYGCNKCNKQEYINYNREFIKAKEITKEHRLHYPLSSYSNNISSINISDLVSDVILVGDRVRVSSNRIKSGKYINNKTIKGDLQNKVDLDYDFMTLLGWYLAEGSSIREQCLQFCLSGDETNVANNLSRILKDKFNLTATISKGRGNSLYVKVYSTLLCRLFVSLCGKYSWGKSINPIILNLNIDKIKPMVDAYFEGDGTVRKGDRYNEKSCVSVSINLINSIRLLLFRLGVFSTISKNPGGRLVQILDNKSKNTTRDSYVLSLTEDSKRRYINDGLYTVRVKELNKLPFSGKVYNLTTESGTYCLPSYIVHNCGEHGSPAFSVFDRKLMLIEDYPVARSSINNISLEQNQGNFSSLLDCPEPLTHDLICLACYDKDTEVLTNSGWKLFKDVTYIDKLATLGVDRNIEYQFPRKLISYKYTGDMYNIGSRFIDLKVTPNHKVYVSHKKRGGYINNKFELVNIEDVSNDSMKFMNTCNYKGETRDTISIPGYTKEVIGKRGGIRVYKGKEKPLELKTEVFMELLGYFISEGFTGYGRVCISQSKKTNYENFVVIDNFLKDNGFNYTSNDGGFTLYDTQLSNYLGGFSMTKSYLKYIPREFLNLDKKYLLYLFKALMLGDGTKGYNHYGTSSKQLADDFQELVFRLGYSGIIKVTDDIGRKAPNGFTRRVFYHINFQTKYLNPVLNTRGVQHVSTSTYDDMVYCAEVPNHILYVRRCGKPVWCGNCDCGFSNDPSIFTILYLSKGIWRELARFELRRIKYPIQANIIGFLDSIYRFNMITVDNGSSGLALLQILADLPQFKDKANLDRLVPVDFQGNVVTGYEEDGTEIKDRVRKFTIQTLQKWTQNDQIIALSRQDDDVISELERVGFTRDMLGVPKYFVYSPNGGQKGDDHILASLLTWVYGIYNKMYSPTQPKGITGKYSDLASGGWNKR
jgi:intein/homing endonuclease